MQTKDSSSSSKPTQDRINKVLVTGGTGFLGAYIIRALVNAGIQVRAIRRGATLPFFLPGAIAQKVDWVQGDVLDVVSLHDAMQGMEAVIHAAAVVSFHKKDHALMNQVNVDGTCNVVNLALENGVAKFIHISSVAALGRTGKNEKVNEERKWENNSFNTAYAISKHHAEIEVWRGFAEGLSGVILNPSTILGFGDWHRSSCAIFKNVYKGFPWYTEGINGFVGVKDVASATVQLLLSDLTEQRLIVNAANWSFHQLLNTIAQGFDKPVPYRKATPLLGELAWRAEALKYWFTGRPPLLTKESARVAHSHTAFDQSALLQALPHFTFTPLENVIQNSCEKYTAALRQGVISI